MDNQLSGLVRILIISVSLIFGFFVGVLWYFALIPAAILFYVARKADRRNQQRPSRWYEFVALAGAFAAGGMVLCCFVGTMKMLEMSGHKNLVHGINLTILIGILFSNIPWKRLWGRSKQAGVQTPEEEQ
ncbi:hypothetical protein Enr10x_35560 [Gimesia panareensis]|uniref:Uncharacterized protein n=1 Tax=Gimesia panareensis TaxID=2527978 RepID=A0A517Q9B5_9PLAN|nr:hypothetical protein [Gimesia panareensis]QDT28216.1 hypothetical protein Enr10x_35560 [Gimesia panareensis]